MNIVKSITSLYRRVASAGPSVFKAILSLDLMLLVLFFFMRFRVHLISQRADWNNHKCKSTLASAWTPEASPASTIYELTMILLASARNWIELMLDYQFQYGIEAYRVIDTCQVIEYIQVDRIYIIKLYFKQTSTTFLCNRSPEFNVKTLTVK